MKRSNFLIVLLVTLLSFISTYASAGCVFYWGGRIWNMHYGRCDYYEILLEGVKCYPYSMVTSIESNNVQEVTLVLSDKKKYKLASDQQSAKMESILENFAKLNPKKKIPKDYLDKELGPLLSVKGTVSKKTLEQIEREAEIKTKQVAALKD